MTTQESVLRSGDSTWANLVSLRPELRAAAIRDRFDEVLTLGDEAMDAKLQQMILGEYELSTVDLLAFTAARLRVLVSMAGQDAERARRLERAYHRVFDRLPGALAMRRTVTVQTVARTELKPEEVETLRGLFPSLLDQLPGATTSARATGQAPRAAAAARRRPWWKLW